MPKANLHAQPPHGLTSQFIASGNKVVYNDHSLLKGNGYKGQKTPAPGIQRTDAKKSPPRSFAGERITQFLRHLATHFFYAISNDNAYTPVEVQCMYIPMINCLFINENAPQSFAGYMTLDKFRKALRTLPVHKNNQSYHQKRLARVHRKLTQALTAHSERQNRILKECPVMTDLLTLMIGHLASTQIKTLAFDTPNQTLIPNTIYLYSNLPNEIHNISKHAEQYHLDLLYSFQDVLKGCTAYIAGVKRPCQTCFGSLTALKDSLKGKVELIFGTRPGNLWIGQHVIQTKEAVICTCGNVVDQKNFHATLNPNTGNSVTDFDTDSDTDDEADAKIANSDSEETESDEGPPLKKSK